MSHASLIALQAKLGRLPHLPFPKPKIREAETCVETRQRSFLQRLRVSFQSFNLALHVSQTPVQLVRPSNPRSQSSPQTCHQRRRLRNPNQLLSPRIRLLQQQSPPRPYLHRPRRLSHRTRLLARRLAPQGRSNRHRRDPRHWRLASLARRSHQSGQRVEFFARLDRRTTRNRQQEDHQLGLLDRRVLFNQIGAYAQGPNLCGHLSRWWIASHV